MYTILLSMLVISNAVGLSVHLSFMNLIFPIHPFWSCLIVPLNLLLAKSINFSQKQSVSVDISDVICSLVFSVVNTDFHDVKCSKTSSNGMNAQIYKSKFFFTKCFLKIYFVFYMQFNFHYEQLSFFTYIFYREL